MRIIKSKYYYEERIFLTLFFLVIILSQGIREAINTNINTTVLNYHIMAIMVIICAVFRKKNKIDKINLIFVIGIIGLITINYIEINYETNKFIRSLLAFVFPIFILLINYNNIRMEKIYRRILKIFNLFMYISFAVQVLISIDKGRTGGIIGHPLTAGWYYAIFISLNCVYNRYFSKKKDILILKDIIISLIGTIIASSRISMIAVLILSILYINTCCKNKILLWIIAPTILFIIVKSSIADKYIWEKFRYAAAWGDITNGRLLGIRKMASNEIYPNWFIGKGIGYSNYITSQIFSTVNFENPIIMFSFDYGIVTLLFLLFIIFIRPIYIFIKSKNIVLLLNFIVVIIIPFSYNGIAESVGLFIILPFIVYVFMAINITIIDKNTKEMRK